MNQLPTLTRRLLGEKHRLSESLSPEANSFGVVRLVAAIAVVLSHNFAIRAGDIYADPIHAWTGFSLGKHAVHVFFILSGLLVSLSLARSTNLADYLRSRFLRIYPGFIACVLLSAFVLGPLVSSTTPSAYFASLQVPNYVFETLGLITARQPLPGVFASNPYANEVNLSLWTLKYEIFCYVLLAAMSAAGLLLTRIRRTLALGGLALVLAITYLIPNVIADDSLLDGFRRFIICFSLGALAYTHRDTLVLSPSILLAGCMLGTLAYGTSIAVPMMLLLTAYGTLVVAGKSFGPLSRWTERHDLSYGIYLYGWPIAQTMLALWPNIGLWELQLASLAIASIFAMGSWNLVERPALLLRKRKQISRARNNALVTSSL